MDLYFGLGMKLPKRCQTTRQFLPSAFLILSIRFITFPVSILSIRTTLSLCNSYLHLREFVEMPQPCASCASMNQWLNFYAVGTQKFTSSNGKISFSFNIQYSRIQEIAFTVEPDLSSSKSAQLSSASSRTHFGFSVVIFSVFSFKASSTIYDSILLCWSSSVYLPELLPSFFRLMLQLLARYQRWVSDGVNILSPAKVLAFSFPPGLHGKPTGGNNQTIQKVQPEPWASCTWTDFVPLFQDIGILISRAWSKLFCT